MLRMRTNELLRWAGLAALLVLTGMGLAVGASFRVEDQPGVAVDPHAVGIDQRVIWNNTRLTGNPNPPLPYTVRNAYPRLKIPCPIAIHAEPGSNRILILNQDVAWSGQGHLLRFVDDPQVDRTEKLLDIDGIGYGMAFHPNFATNGYLYVGSNGPLNARDKTTRVIRYTLSRTAPFGVVPGSETMIIQWPSDGHNGGDLAFGPDGMLYISSGDGTSDSDANLAGQNTTHLLAKVLRIDVDHPDSSKAYSVPGDNPFVGKAGYRPETWAYGLRNPWRLHIDSTTGDVWVGNNGQDLWEQVYLIGKGKNYGWSIVEGTHTFYPERKAGPDPIAKPIVEHPHSEARSLTGGRVYRGKSLPKLAGAYVYGDWSTGKIWGVRHKSGVVDWHQELASTTLQITGFGTDSQGELLVADHGGNALYRLEVNPAPGKVVPFPQKLSETGLFERVQEHQVSPGLIPYSPVAPFWSDGAHKVRYLALPGSVQIDFTTGGRAWNFPDLTVLVKSFALNTTPADPMKRTWIETRLMIRQQGQWAGYSYRWNEAGTDADLVDGTGMDQTFRVVDEQSPGGIREQQWHYPSRTECLVCHSRAANWVLGLSQLQLNRIHDYPARPANQLRTLEHLGIFRVPKQEYLDEKRRELESLGRHLLEPATLAGKVWSGCPETVSKVLNHMEQPLRASLDRLGSEVLRPFAGVDKLWQGEGTTTWLARRPEAYPALANPYDRSADLDQRARAWLHTNCAQCHVLAGGGNALMELEATTSRSKMNIVNVKPQHSTFDIPDARLIVPGHPEKSILFQRMSRRGPGQMPPLASSRVDPEGVELLREWIRTMPENYVSVSP